MERPSSVEKSAKTVREYIAYLEANASKTPAPTPVSVTNFEVYNSYSEAFYKMKAREKAGYKSFASKVPNAEGKFVLYLQ